MTIDVTVESDKQISLEEFKELYREAKFDSRSCDDLVEAALLLRQLGNNKQFLGDYIKHELTTNLERQVGNSYGPHNVILGHATENTMLRANFWPSAEDEEYKKSSDMFIYDMPHDHNFSFLTIGYFGPGYRSTYFEYEYGELDGVPGELANLRQVAVKTLEPEAIMVYRAHRDVHCQHLPESMSVTLNVMDITPGFQYHQQYVFDAKVERIRVVNSARCSSNMFDVAAVMGGAEARETVIAISEHHDSEFARFHALRAAIKATDDPQERERLVRRGIDNPSRAVRAWTARYVDKQGLGA